MRKKFYKSKTLMVNFATVALLVIDRFSGSGLISEELAPYIIGGLNVVLRILTKGPLRW